MSIFKLQDNILLQNLRFFFLFRFCVYIANRAINETIARSFRTSTSLSKVFGCQITRTNLYIYVDKSAHAVYIDVHNHARNCTNASRFAAARSTLTIHKRAALFTRSFCPNHPLARTNNVKRIMKRYGFYGPFSFPEAEDHWNAEYLIRRNAEA